MKFTQNGFDEESENESHPDDFPIDTYLPVARLKFIQRLLLALAVKYNLKIHQIDITTAYLSGTIEEETYMELPELLTECLEKIVRSRAKEMLNQDWGGEKVYRLQKVLYGLKQAGHQWYNKLNEKLRKLDLKSTCVDPCVSKLLQKRGRFIASLDIRG